MSPTVILMARSRIQTQEGSSGRSAWRRLGKLMSEWLCLLSCLSGNIYFGADVYGEETPSLPRRMSDPRQPDLQTQLEDLFDCVWRQEKVWRMENRIQGSGS